MAFDINDIQTLLQKGLRSLLLFLIGGAAMNGFLTRLMNPPLESQISFAVLAGLIALLMAASLAGLLPQRAPKTKMQRTGAVQYEETADAMTSAIERAVAAVGPKPYYEHAGVTIYHGDCRELLPDLEADIVITDPPYNAGKTYGPNTNDDREWPEWAAWFDDRLDLMLVSAPDVLAFLSITAYTKYLRHGRREPFWAAVWHKPLALSVCASPFMPHWEPIAFWGTSRKQRGTEKAGWGSDVFRANVETGQSRHGHPTPKPLALMRDLIVRTTNKGDTVLDPFMGSGTTLVAAKHLGRRAIGVEIEEKYAEMAAKRLEQEVMAL